MWLWVNGVVTRLFLLAATTCDFEIVEVLCDQILANSCMDKNGNVKVDTCKKYLMYIYTIFDQYTNIIVHSDKWLEEFNLLSKVGLVEAVCQLMPENLITTLDSVLKMRTDDMMTNYYEPHAFISNQVLKYAPMIHSAIDKFLNGVEKISKEVDWNGLVDKLKEVK
jgi:predicted S18 family serine protease